MNILNKNIVMRKVTEKDIFGDTTQELNSSINKKMIGNVHVADFRKQAEYGERKFIKP